MAKNFNRVSKRNMMAVQARKICRAFEEEAEDILKDVEEAVKENFPGRSVKASLNTISEKLNNEGIKSVKFDTTVSRTQLRKTADVDATPEEVDEALEEIVRATVEEIEDLLEDTDAYADSVVDSVKEEDTDDVVDACAIENELKCNIESGLRNLGINCRLARKQAPKKTAKRHSRRTVAKKSVKRANPILSRMTK